MTAREEGNREIEENAHDKRRKCGLRSTKRTGTKQIKLALIKMEECPYRRKGSVITK